MKKPFSLGLICLLYLGGGALLQRCGPPFGGGDPIRFVIEDLDWTVGPLRADSLVPNRSYHRDSLVINTRLRRIYYLERAALWTPIPTSLAYEPADPQSKQFITQFNITLLDSLQLQNGDWLLPQSNVNAFFDVLWEYSEYPRSQGISNFLAQKPHFQTPFVPLRMRWNAALALSSSLRLSIQLKLDDGQSFKTPENEPLVMRLLAN
ncbi:MAG: hypothetical protein Q8J69_09830 [Sphingobacteriaceae bacterium]|nr:hypothetical protein [Sphingobacteriaceae bacterium]